MPDLKRAGGGIIFTMKSIFVVSLKWDITFNDSDEGRCYAGEGRRLLMAFLSSESANEFISKWSQAITEASEDIIVWPVQTKSKKIKEGLGFTLHDIDSDGRDFCLTIDEVIVSP